MKDFLAPLLTFLGGILVAYLTAILKFRKDLEAEYDKTLRAKRMESYEKLWAATQPLALYGREQPLTRELLNQMAITLRKWYFEGGGLYLTQASKDNYFALQKRIATAKNEEDPIGEATFNSLQQLGSALRTGLANDIGSKLATRLSPEEKN